MSGGRPRPLLPTDEDQITSQFERRHEARGVLDSNKQIDDHLGPTMRSTSNWSLADIHLRRPDTTQRALTDTDNFIQMYSAQSGSRLKDSESKEGVSSSSDEDQITLEEESNLLTHSYHNSDELTDTENDEQKEDEEEVSSEGEKGSNSELEHEMELDPELKRRREEWATKGAATIVKEVTNPSTGIKTKRVVKKGIKDFKFGETLGDGSYSTVILATSKDSGKKYALKILSKEYLIRQKKVKYVNIEKNALQRLNNSRGIVKLFFTFQDESSLYFLLEYAPNGDFLSVIKKCGSLSEDCARYYSAQIIDAIDFIHSKGIVHRDIKPENILLDKDMKVKLTDFGTAKILEAKPNTSDSFDLLTRSKSFVGTAEYVSPELLNDSYVDYRCDIWAFGCILFQMIAGKPPFKATNEYLTFQKVMKVQYAFTAGFPLVIRDLVKRILIKQPDQRLTIFQIKKHYFFEGTNFNDDSVWNNRPPEIQPYKINAKSMQPIPALSTSAVPQIKRPVIVKPTAKSTSTLPTKSQDLNTSDGSKKGSTTSTMSQMTPSKKALDERTAQILNNARKAVGNRKQAQLYKTTGGAASAASAALTKKSKTPPPLSPRAQSVSGGSSKSKTSSTSRTTTLIGLNTTHSSGHANPISGSRRTSRSASVAVSNANSSAPSSSDVGDIPPLPSMSKVDIIWSYYLRSIDERVLAADEVHLAVLDSDNLEKRVQRAHGSLMEPHTNGNSRGTLLSQVARGGGGVTGFRSDSNIKLLPQKMYYEEMLIDNENISKDYRKPGGDFSLSQSEKTNAPTQSSSTDNADENGAFPLSGKFKKIFQHSIRTEQVNDPIPPNEFFKRMLVITSLGRCLLFVKKTKCIPDTKLNFELMFEINLCQSGIRVKDVILPSTENSTERCFAIQSPYNSFIIRSDKIMADNWLNVINKSIRINHERLVAKSKKEDEQKNSALKAARLASPILAREGHTSEHVSHNEHLSSNQQTTSRSSRSPTLTASSSSSPNLQAANINHNKHPTVVTTSTSSSTMGKGSRLFDHFVSSKEKSSRKHANPVPIATRLVNGLPSNSTQGSIGLGISELDVSGGKTYFTSKTSKKPIADGTSRLLSRSEMNFRPKH